MTMRKSILSSAAKAKRARKREEAEDCPYAHAMAADVEFANQQRVEAYYRAQHCKDLIDKIDKEIRERNAQIAKRWDDRLRRTLQQLFRSLYDQ